MKRFHVHVSVHDLQQSVRFYAALFHTLEAAPVYGKDAGVKAVQPKSAGCCGPRASQ